MRWIIDYWRRHWLWLTPVALIVGLFATVDHDLFAPTSYGSAFSIEERANGYRRLGNRSLRRSAWDQALHEHSLSLDFERKLDRRLGIALQLYNRGLAYKGKRQASAACSEWAEAGTGLGHTEGSLAVTELDGHSADDLRRLIAVARRALSC